MKNFARVMLLTVLFVCTLAAGSALALPASVTDATGDATYDGVADTMNGYNAATGANARYNTQTGTGVAEHSNNDAIGGTSSYGPHGKFTTDTNACGRCHQLHQAKSERLIRFDFSSSYATVNNPIYGICTYCHSFNGQSTYDVVDGMIWDTQNGDRYATNGGGFERMLVVEGPASVATVVKANSSHQVNMAKDANGYISFTVPGGADTANKHIELKCSSCHNPHGSANARALVEDPAYTEGTKASANGTWTALTGVNAIPEFVQNRFTDEKSVYDYRISKFCAACHRNYLNDSGTSGSVKTGTQGGDPGAYRHRMNMSAGDGFNSNGQAGSDSRTNDGSFGYSSSKLQLPLGTDGVKNDLVVCTTCHFAHGTFAEMTKDVINNTGTPGTNADIDTSATSSYKLLTQVGGTGVDSGGNTMYETIKNLRMDNRAVCQNCHNRNSVDPTKPKLTKIVDPASTGVNLYSNSISGAANYSAASVGGTKYLVVRFDRYMAKGAAETTGNYTGIGTVSSATLMPDGRSVLLKGTLSTGTLTVNTAVTDINGVNLDNAGGINQLAVIIP